MMMPHPLLPVSLPPASVAMAMNQMNHLNTIANMAAAAQMHSPLSRAGASVIKVTLAATKFRLQWPNAAQSFIRTRISQLESAHFHRVHSTSAADPLGLVSCSCDTLDTSLSRSMSHLTPERELHSKPS